MLYRGLWCHLKDPQLEKRSKKRFNKDKDKEKPAFDSSGFTWLDKAAYHGDADYIHILCGGRLSQDVLDRAFGTALSMQLPEAMRMLLSFGAVATSFRDAIRDQVEMRNYALIELLLSAPKSMDTESWCYCIESEFIPRKPTKDGFVNILLLCCATRRDIVSTSMLIGALRSNNFEASAILLAYSNNPEQFAPAQDLACELVSVLPDDSRKLRFFDLLGQAWLLKDNSILQQELAKSVATRRKPVVQTLVSAGVSLDSPPYYTFYQVVRQMDLDMLQLFKGGNFTMPVSHALKFVPEGVSEPELMQLLDILASMGLSGVSLDPHLVRAAQLGYLQLAVILLQYGASVAFDNAAAVRVALANLDLEMVSVLLRNDCPPEILPSIIPSVMGLPPGPARREVMYFLLGKGIHSHHLSSPVQKLVSEDGETDTELIRALMDHGASLDIFGNDETHPILIAAQKGDLEVLTMLCDAQLWVEPLGSAVRIAYEALSSVGYDTVLDMIKLLLRRGATGLPVTKTLLDAARTDTRLDIVRTLVTHGADANYASGASYVLAITMKNKELLEVLCSGCKPNLEGLGPSFVAVLNRVCYDYQTLELILASASEDTVPRISWDVERLRGHPKIAEIIPCILQHGMDVNMERGSLLRFAIEVKAVDLLETILSSDPKLEYLAAAFQKATKVEPRDIKLKIMGCLLLKAESAEIGQSQLLMEEAKLALKGDLSGLQLILDHKADVDLDGGKALQKASAAGSLPVMDLLLSAKPTRVTLLRAFISAVSSAGSAATKQHIFSRLLTPDSKVPSQWTSKALVESISSDPGNMEVPQLLISHGATVDYQILEIALQHSPQNIFELLASNIGDVDVAERAFRFAHTTAMPSERRHWIYSSLLDNDVGPDEVSAALISALKDDPHELDMPKLLLDHRAEVGYKDGMAFKLALQSYDPKCFRLLSQFIADDSTANIAFELARNESSLDHNERLEIYNNLVQWNIRKSSLFAALTDALQGGSSELDTVSLLLQGGADPNEDRARLFFEMCTSTQEAAFRTLSKYANPDIVLPRLLNRFILEESVYEWWKICLEEMATRNIRIKNESILVECLRRFPDSSRLVELLLQHGVSASAMVEQPLCEGWSDEPCTVLLWAIFSKPEIDNKVLRRIIAQESGGKISSFPEPFGSCGLMKIPTAALKCSTPETKVSAVFGCLLYKDRTPLLVDVLTYGGAEIMEQTISGSTFAKLAAGTADTSDEEFGALFGEEDDISPLEASLFLGNFEAFRIILGDETPDDNILHLAALLALPIFILWLLDDCGLDPNGAAESFGFMIPMALACSSQPFPWCKIANEDADWSTRLKQTMNILARSTDTTWRLGNKSILHMALESGLEVTKAVVEALDIANDPEKDKKYEYKDRTGITYTPTEYISKLLDANEGEKWKLVTCLEDHDSDVTKRKALKPKRDGPSSFSASMRKASKGKKRKGTDKLEALRRATERREAESLAEEMRAAERREAKATIEAIAKKRVSKVV